MHEIEKRLQLFKHIYNNFPFPENVGEQEKTAVEQSAQEVLEVRKRYAPRSLASLYDPEKMPADVLAAHQRDWIGLLMRHSG